MTNWGGKRPNAGRKPEFNEPTVKVRIPTSLLADFKAWLKEKVGKKENNDGRSN